MLHWINTVKWQAFFLLMIDWLDIEPQWLRYRNMLTNNWLFYCDPERSIILINMIIFDIEDAFLNRQMKRTLEKLLRKYYLRYKILSLRILCWKLVHIFIAGQTLQFIRKLQEGPTLYRITSTVKYFYKPRLQIGVRFLF